MKGKFTKVHILFLGMFAGGFVFLLWNPFAHIAESSETTATTRTETTVTQDTLNSAELAAYAEKYGSVVPNLLVDLGGEGYRVNVDLALLDDDKMEILIKKYEITEDLTTKEINEIKQLVPKLLKDYHLDPTMFNVDVSNETQPILKTANRLSYRDVTEYMMNELDDRGIGGFHIYYEITQAGSEIIIKLGEPFDETKDRSKVNEIKEVAESVLMKNNFNLDLVQVKVTGQKN